MLKRIWPLAAIIIALFYLLSLYLFVIIKTHKNPSVSVCSETLHECTSQHLLLLVGFDTLINRKYCDRSPILVGHHRWHGGGTRGRQRGCKGGMRGARARTSEEDDNTKGYVGRGPVREEDGPGKERGRKRRVVVALFLFCFHLLLFFFQKDFRKDRLR